MPSGNGEYKDRLFNFLFGSEENRVWTLRPTWRSACGR